MKYSSYKGITLIIDNYETVGGGQFKWGAFLLKSSGEVYKVS